ncbi:MAG: SRPBCC domain-containing protein [Deltaproteobacteria bacterium]|nr:SRPBCC domain-containing protein [Deltaproteobacteria bacterium]
MTDRKEPVLRVVRRLPASPDEVFDAWVDAESLREWMCPGTTHVSAAEVDPRVGGRFRIVMSDDAGDTEHTGEYRELRRPERLVFTWISKNTLDRETLVTVELRPIGQETELTLTHERLPDDEARRKHERGWTTILEKLAAHLGKGTEDGR